LPERILMMIQQQTIVLPQYPKGIHLITQEVLNKLEVLPDLGLLHLFLLHTSAALSINENYDPTVRLDSDYLFDTLIREHLPALKHTLEGPDDMPAHFKSLITGCSLTIPIMQQRLHLGTWQGIYLCEFRHHASRRHLVCTIIG